ncbi:unnamed protein product [Sphagnum troendelagicum]|uniref:Uncharacterized protein n=1 Tax=Sphagnum troendelagicum TaxID=128251 RepID=A0ABP0UYA3_9BRYO
MRNVRPTRACHVRHEGGLRASFLAIFFSQQGRGVDVLLAQSRSICTHLLVHDLSGFVAVAATDPHTAVYEEFSSQISALLVEYCVRLSALNLTDLAEVLWFSKFVGVLCVWVCLQGKAGVFGMCFDVCLLPDMIYFDGNLD